jgi:hypothetical protein
MARREIISSIAMVAFLSLTSQAAIANSTHDHSTVSYKWVLSKNLQAKIDRRISSANNSSFIGLNHFEQKNWNVMTSMWVTNLIQRIKESTSLWKGLQEE